MVLTFFIPDMHKIEIILRMKSADSCYFSKHHELYRSPLGDTGALLLEHLQQYPGEVQKALESYLPK